MTINVKTIQAGIANTVSTLVGASLSETGTAPNNLPSVFIARSLPTKPSYPYCVIDFIQPMVREGRDFTSTYQDTDANLVHISDFILTYQISFYGNVDNDVMLLAQQCADLILTHQGKELIETNTTHILRDVENIGFSSAIKNTEYEEVAVLPIQIAARSTLTDTSVGSIETITVDDSGLYQDIDDPTPDFDIDVTVP